MPNTVKYKTGNLTGSIQKGNVALGLSSLGPTSTTGWYNGITPNSNRYVIYKTDISNPPKIYHPLNDSELIRFAKQEGATGADTGSAISALSWIDSQTNLMAVNKAYPTITTDGLIYSVDSTFIASYPTIGNTWYDISGGGSTGILNNNPTFNPDDRSIAFDGIDDYVNSGYDLSWNNTNSISISFWMNPSTVSGGNYGIIGKEYPNWEWAFYQSGTTLNLVYWNTGGGHTNGTDFSVNAFPTANTWYHVVYTWDGSTSIFYVNGVALGSKVATDPSINQNRPNNVMIGGHTYVWADAYWNGKISNVNFYNKTLTQAGLS